MRGRLHVRFCERIGVRFGVRFAANGIPQVIFLFVCAEMCGQTSVMGRLLMSRADSSAGAQQHTLPSSAEFYIVDML
jgi:hypothetical protein